MKCNALFEAAEKALSKPVPSGPGASAPEMPSEIEVIRRVQAYVAEAD